VFCIRAGHGAGKPTTRLLRTKPINGHSSSKSADENPYDCFSIALSDRVSKGKIAGL
jgi:hypothetical protein